MYWIIQSHGHRMNLIEPQPTTATAAFPASKYSSSLRCICCKVLDRKTANGKAMSKMARCSSCPNRGNKTTGSIHPTIHISFTGDAKEQVFETNAVAKIPLLLTFQMNIQHPQLNSVNIAKLDKYHINYCDQILPTIPAIHILVEVHIPFLFPSHPRPIFQTRIHQLVRYYHHCDSCYYHHCVFFISCRRLNYS